jgi:hypothetical protein
VARGGGSAPVFGLAVEGRDPSQRVVIDPGFDLAFVYASFAFPPGDIEFYSVEVDPTTDVPVMAGYDDVNAIVTSYDLVAGVLLWVTIIGGPGGTTVGTDLAFDAAGDIYACGVTDSPALPTTPGVFQFFAPGLGDAWVAHLTPIGGIIELSYLGGLLGSEYGNTAIDIGADGMVTLAGYTESLDFPVGPPFVFDPIYNGGGDVWVMRIAPTLAFPFFSTFLGDVGNEFPGIGGVAVSPEGTVVVGGFTDSAAFPTAAATDPTYGGATDAFLTKLTGPLGALVYSTFRGGAGFDCFNGVGVDDTGAAWGAGYTESAAAGPMGPPGVLDLTYNGAGDALLVKHGPLGGFIWSTWRGGDGVDSAYGIAVDPFGRAHISGTTNSGYAASVVPYPTTPPDGFAPFDLPAGSYDAFVECIGPDGDITSYGSTLNVGGGFDEWFTGIAIGAEGNTLLAGAIAPGPLPLANAPIIRCIMPWGDEENSLTGTTTPQLMGDGTLVAGSPVELRFTNLVPGSLVTLFVGGPLFLPFAGGTLVPAAMIVIGGLPVNPAGQVNLAGVWPPGLPADTLLYMQGWVPDPGSPSGLAATNGVRMWTP